MWYTLCSVLQRGEELIAESFSAVAIRLRTPLEACIEAACHMEAVSLTHLTTQVSTSGGLHRGSPPKTSARR